MRVLFENQHAYHRHSGRCCDRCRTGFHPAGDEGQLDRARDHVHRLCGRSVPADAQESYPSSHHLLLDIGHSQSGSVAVRPDRRQSDCILSNHHLCGRCSRNSSCRFNQAGSGAHRRHGCGGGRGEKARAHR